MNVFFSLNIIAFLIIGFSLDHFGTQTDLYFQCLKIWRQSLFRDSATELTASVSKINDLKIQMIIS